MRCSRSATATASAIRARTCSRATARPAAGCFAPIPAGRSSCASRPEPRAWTPSAIAQSATGASEASIALPFLRWNISDRRRELCMNQGIDGPVPDLGTRWVFAEEVVAFPVLRWPDGSGDEPAAAVWTDVAQDRVDARRAKRALVSANARFERIRRQGLVAVFAGRAHFEHSAPKATADAQA